MGARAQPVMRRQPWHHEQRQDHAGCPTAQGAATLALFTTSLPMWGLGPSVPPGSPARHLGIMTPLAQRVGKTWWAKSTHKALEGT